MGIISLYRVARDSSMQFFLRRRSVSLRFYLCQFCNDFPRIISNLIDRLQNLSIERPLISCTIPRFEYPHSSPLESRRPFVFLLQVYVSVLFFASRSWAHRPERCSSSLFFSSVFFFT